LKTRILVFFGTRPEIVKLAPVIHALRAAGAGRIEVCDSGQHPHLSGPLMKWFGVRAHHRLRLMNEGQSLAKLSAKALGGADGLISRTRPGLIVCQGDTTTAMMVGLAAYCRRVPLAHVEAGLRTWDRLQPYPEEVNRRFLSLVADLHLAPTRAAARNLRAEKVASSRIAVTGNTSIDALLWTVRRLRRHPLKAREFEPSIRRLLAGPERKPKFVILTAHRRESFGPRIQKIGKAVRELARRHPDWHWLVPLHPNPNAGPVLARLLKKIPNVILCRPLNYPQFCFLLDRCRFAITDSGGIQEEAPAVGKPVIVVREKTERPEAMKTGHLRLAGYDPRSIIRAAEGWMNSPARLRRLSRPVFPYGDGKAARRIARAVKKFLKAN
jgi:UDP-N-acetylglucosamine 2-epimerase (non-hydrolysing)